MFETGTIAVEPYSGGHVATSGLEVLNPQKTPFITNYDFLEPLSTELINNSKFLQKVILKQENAIEQLQEENLMLKNKLTLIEHV